MMMSSKNVVSALRRDVSFVWNAVIAVVFIGFASLAVAQRCSTWWRSATSRVLYDGG